MTPPEPTSSTPEVGRSGAQEPIQAEQVDIDDSDDLDVTQDPRTEDSQSFFGGLGDAEPDESSATAGSVRRPTTPVLIGIVVVALIVACGGAGVVAMFLADGFGSGDAGTTSPTGDTAEAQGVLRYELEATSAVNIITYVDGKAGSVRVEGDAAKVPWKVEVPCCTEATYKVVAVLVGPNPGRATCRIVRDDKVLVEESAEGSVTCGWSPKK